MTVFSGGYQPDINTGLMNLNSIKNMLYCIAQEDSSARELDAYTLLGISNILDNAGHEIEQAYDKVSEEHDVLYKRHNKLRAALAAYAETDMLVNKSYIANILDDDEKEGAHAI